MSVYTHVGGRGWGITREVKQRVVVDFLVKEFSVADKSIDLPRL